MTPILDPGSTEEFCDGFPVMRNQSTGEELQCAGEIVDDCPPEGYCHIIENGGRCCQGCEFMFLSQYLFNSQI